MLIVVLLTNNNYAQNKLQSFPISSVQIHESPFYQAQQVDLHYILELKVDRLLAPFLIDAGFKPKDKRYPNWENTGLDGHIGGHYLSALSLMYASTGNKELLERLYYMIDWLAKCQEKNGNGYVGGVPGGKEMWKDIANGKIDAGIFSLNSKWVPWYNMHKLYAGLRDVYQIAGIEKAKDILIKLSDWCIELTKNLSDEQMQDMLRSEHGGMNEVFVDVAEITGDEKYLTLAKRFSHRAILDPLIAHENKLTGLHANTQIPKVVGYKKIGDYSNEKEWTEAAALFWDLIIDNWTICIGGNSVREHLHPPDDFSSMVTSNQGPETCNTYNMLRLTKLLFLTNSDVKYMDYYERALYNHILSTEHPDKGGFVYFTPMRPRHYRVYSQPHQCFWCCVGSGLENHGKYGEMIYAHSDNDIYVNLFIPSKLEWKEKGIGIEQITKFPFEEKTKLKIILKKPQKFALKIRYPGWVKEAELEVTINEEVTTLETIPSSYITLNRKWENGDEVDIKLPMQTKLEYLPDQSDWASILHGPIVLAAKTDTTDLVGLFADDSRMGHVANGPMYPIDEAPMLISENRDFSDNIQSVTGKPLTLQYTGTVYPDKYQNIELIPFFMVHDARYIVYFPVNTPDELEKRKFEMERREQAMLALEAQTIDHVATGEQQPESDHNFKGERTESGIYENRYWRHAHGWFSYDLKDPNKQARTLRVTYFGVDKGRTFDILLNNKLLVTVSLDGSKGHQFVDVDYNIPQNIIDTIENGILTVKFVAHENSMAGGVFDIRLLK